MCFERARCRLVWPARPERRRCCGRERACLGTHHRFAWPERFQRRPAAALAAAHAAAAYADTVHGAACDAAAHAAAVYADAALGAACDATAHAAAARAAALAAARHAVAVHAAATRRRNTAFSAPRTARGSRGWNSAAAAPGDKATSAPNAARASGARTKRGSRANQSPVECIVKDVDIVFASVADAQNETPRELLDQADNEEGADTLQLGDNFECAAAGAAAESNDILPPPVIATPAEPEQGEFSKLAASEQSKPGEYARATTRPAPPPCGSRSCPPRPCALADVVNELEQSAFATPLEPELGEPSERELKTGERGPEPREPSPRADSNGDERTMLLIINKRSTANKKTRGLPSQRHTSCYSKRISRVYLGIIDSNVRQGLAP